MAPIARTRRKAAKPRRAPAPAMRRVPTQERSKARLERILDAGDAVFAEFGYDATTIEEIAARAKTSVGSVYQFFPNKKALFHALRTRYLERARELFERLLTPEALAKPWPEIVDLVVDAFWEFHCKLPGFRAVWVHQSITAKMIAEGDQMNRIISARAADVLALFAPSFDAEKRAAVGTALVEMISALLFVAVRREEPESSRIVLETKEMARAYLGAVLGGAGSQG